MDKKKRLNSKVIFNIVLLVFGAILIMIGPAQGFMLNKLDEQAEQPKKIEITAEEIEKNNSNDNVVYAYDEVEPVQLEGLVKSQLDNIEFATVGVIAVPSVGINMPIIKGISDEGLYAGAGTMKPDMKMGEGNYSLVGHNLPGRRSLMFSPLNRFELGEFVYITDMKTIYVYQVNDMITVTPDHVEVIEDDPQRRMITLVKCNDDGNYRDVFSGDLVARIPVGSATDEIKGYFNVDFT